MKKGTFRVSAAHVIRYTKGEREKLVLKAKRTRGGASHSAGHHRFSGFLGKGGRSK